MLVITLCVLCARKLPEHTSLTGLCDGRLCDRCGLKRDGKTVELHGESKEEALRQIFAGLPGDEGILYVDGLAAARTAVSFCTGKKLVVTDRFPGRVRYRIEEGE
jgi:hypothetical protein